VLSLNELGVFEGASRKLRERITVCRDTLSVHLEATLLRHRGIPDIVGCEKGTVQNDISQCREAVVLRIVGRHVDHGVNVGL
jgi:hypothetical protein